MVNRHLSRTIVMQSLFEWDFHPQIDPWAIVGKNIQVFEKKVDPTYTKKSIKGIFQNLKDIDQKILDAAPEWPIEQIAPIDKAILRLAVYEVLYSEEVPPKVAINEAVELAKSFGGDNSSKFVNGVLGTVYRQSKKYNPKDDDYQKTPEQ
ncbi:transcription antitermination factor NusB [Candidatus Berkelbacteria bacterium]|nr:transcription antitermination factor NusB [Candidatus Berkelbacteria bacterium]